MIFLICVTIVRALRATMSGKKKKDCAPAIAVSPAAPAALPMFKPKARAQAATQVGNYAIQITFNDGHATGIYSYEHLRTLCPCDECAKVFRQEPKSAR